MNDKTSILTTCIEWLHNALAEGQKETFWINAKSAIRGDVYGVDTTAADWDLTHCQQYPALWLYATVHAGRVYLEDSAGAEAARQAYMAEAERAGTAPANRGTTGQLKRPGYGA